MYKTLDFQKIVETINRLENRISERFPHSGLRQVCNEFHGIASISRQKVAWLNRPLLSIRISVWVLIACALFLAAYTISAVEWRMKIPGLAEVIQLTEALINDIVLAGAGLFFLASLETRIKRARVLNALHELRSLAHVVDMHQLTKDPSLIDGEQCRTPTSPVRDMTTFELKRYLDYCSELLSLIGKLAAIYSQHMPDPEIVSAANDIEELCSNLSRKVWQKIVIVNGLD